MSEPPDELLRRLRTYSPGPAAEEAKIWAEVARIENDLRRARGRELDVGFRSESPAPQGRTGRLP